jgi:hypothetical protein
MTKRFKVILKKTTDFMDKSKSGKDRFNAKVAAGEYIATLEPNPSDKNGDDWLLFEGTTIGSTLKYIKTVAYYVTALS